jgi:hypothetical protein
LRDTDSVSGFIIPVLNRRDFLFSSAVASPLGALALRAASTVQSNPAIVSWLPGFLLPYASSGEATSR